VQSGEPRSAPLAAILTAPGRGAIGVIRVWGTGAVDLADGVFRPARGRGLASTRPGRLRLGRIGRGLGDEVVAVVLGGSPRSVEIQCHGGPAATGLVLEALRSAGARLVDWPRCVADHAASTPQAEAAEDLARAPTVRTAEILLEQSQGALEAELAGIARAIDRQSPDAAERLDRLIERAPIGLRLVDGWRVVIVGRPNVGKSRLLNALAGYQRAIVDPTPGTTRDAVTVAAALDGWPVVLVDTAGQRPTDDPIERAGIDQATRQHAGADLVLKVLDRSEPLTDGDRALLAAPGPALVVASKADLPPAWQPEVLGPEVAGVVTVSAEREAGLDELIAAIVAAVVPHPPEPGAGVPFRPRHLRHLGEARALLAANDRRGAIGALGAIGDTRRPDSNSIIHESG
jgi:tRNA modification GTPase